MVNFDKLIANRIISDLGHRLNRCSICDSTLSELDFFTVAKAYNVGKFAFEAVHCFSCQLATKNYASAQSIENMMLYSGRRFNAFLQDSIQRKLYHLADPSCLITGEELMRTDSFELYTFNVPSVGLGENNYVLVGPTAMEQMSDLLSEETRESWGRYTKSLTPDMPEIVVSPMFMG